MGGLPLWAVGVAVLVIGLWVIFTQTGRAVAMTALVILVLVGLKRALVREAGGCDYTLESCRIDLQPQWAGPCFSSQGGAIASEAGRYYLVADGLTVTSATCIDIRIW